jgi:aspartate aminotransferase-like enzyme
MDADDFMEWLYREHGIRIAGGTGSLSGRIIRISHMATAANPEVVSAFLAAARLYISVHRLRAS